MIIARVAQLASLAMLLFLIWTNMSWPAATLSCVMLLVSLSMTIVAGEIKRQRQLNELTDVTAAIVMEAAKRQDQS